MAVNLQNGAQNWWSVDFNTAPFQYRWDYWTALSDGQIPGEGSQTQPECCFQLRPTPSSNWCHCNMDSIQARKYHLLRGQKHVRKCLRRCVCLDCPNTNQHRWRLSVQMSQSCTLGSEHFHQNLFCFPQQSGRVHVVGQHSHNACIHGCSCVYWNSTSWWLLSNILKQNYFIKMNIHVIS